jgi:WD40 repeat protein
MAQVTIAFDAWKEGHVAHSLHAVPIVAPKSSVQLEPVSPRLKGELIHPNRTSHPCGLHFSPDGKRIIAGDDPGGVVVVWDVQSGRDIRTIETGYDYHGDEYLFLSPDWRTVFVPHTGKTNFEQFEKDGKRLFRWEFDGVVRTWDLTTGQLRRTYKHQPPRQIFGMELSPDGRKFVTFERPPGIHAGKPKWTVSLWDTATSQYRPLAKDVQANKARFSPDGRLQAIEAMEDSGYRALELFDTTTGQEKKLSVPAPDKNARLSVSAFSPDVGYSQVITSWLTRTKGTAGNTGSNGGTSRPAETSVPSPSKRTASMNPVSRRTAKRSPLRTGEGWMRPSCICSAVRTASRLTRSS